MKTQYALFDQTGAFSRIEELDPAQLPPIPLADDGLPRAVLLEPKPQKTGKVYSPDRNGAWVEGDADPEPVPPSVTKRQLRRWCVKRGIALDSLRAELAKIPDNQTRDLALVDFDDASEYEITNPLVAQLAAKFGVSKETAFTEAAQE